MSSLFDTLPFARFLGLSVADDGEAFVATMPFSDQLIGDPMLPALHGGSTAALLELTAVAYVQRQFPHLRLPQPINVTLAFLRPGRPADVHAAAHILKPGKRIAVVSVSAWQDDPEAPIATLTAHFKMSEDNF